MNMILAGADCKDCAHFAEKSLMKITCLARDKDYYYGQCIPCEDKEKRYEIKDEEAE